MSLITVNDRRLFVSDEGDGPAVIMLHGLGGTTSMFQPQAEALSDRARVIRVDLAGAGLSAGHAGLSVETWAEDVVAVLDALGVTRAVVVGHSLGTLVAAQLAARHPERVRAVVALGPVRSQPEPVKAATRERAAKVRAGGMEVVVDGVVAMAVGERTRKEHPVVAAFVHASVLGQDPAGYAASCEALADAAEPSWSAIQARTWLVGGSEDRLSTPETVDAIAAQLTQAHQISLPGVGHWSPIENPAAVTHVIDQALKEEKEETAC